MGPTSARPELGVCPLGQAGRAAPAGHIKGGPKRVARRSALIGPPQRGAKVDQGTGVLEAGRRTVEDFDRLPE